MQIRVKTYHETGSPLHRLDARLKIALMAAATVGLFFANSLPAMLACAVVVLVLALVARVPFRLYAPFLPAALIFALFPLVVNGFSFNVEAAQENLVQYYGAVALTDAEPLVLAGSFGIVPAGLLLGAVLGLRIFLLIALSLLFTFATEANSVVAAISWYLRPLGKLGVPVRDIATVFSLVLRFIPVIAEELGVVADAHRMRGAQLDSGSPVARMRAWGGVFIPLFVRLFRRAEVLGTAMDARCYGKTTAKR